MPEKEFKFRRNVDIGNLEAEHDQFLVKAFVEKEDYKILKDVNDSKSIIMGRTGSGKSALIRYLESQEEFVKRINPETLSLRHLSNSNIISYFNNIGIKLDLFYKTLWKHVFIVELIKLHFQEDDQKSFQLIRWLKEKFQNNKRRRVALDYLEEWENRFWEDTEYRIKEMESSLENRFLDEFGGDADFYNKFKISGKHEAETHESERIKIEVFHKAQKVVNETQIEKIQEIIKILEEALFSNTQRKYYIVIDDLDKNWVDSYIVYDLIKALIEVVKEFQSIKQVKIILALRTNINQVIFKFNSTRGIQREKYNHLYLPLQWNKEELKELVNNRLKELMRGQYTKESPVIEDILPSATKRELSGFDYIIERTLMRPRDVIDFFNKCIKYSDGKTKIHREIIKKAEDEYSHERLRAINDEWFENHGNLFVLYGFLKSSLPSFTIGDIHDKTNSYFVEIITNGKVKELSTEWQDEFSRYEKDMKPVPLLKKILTVLYDVGILGVKIDGESSKEFSHEAYSMIKEDDIHKSKTKFYIHPMFYKALRINTRKLIIEDELEAEIEVE